MIKQKFPDLYIIQVKYQEACHLTTIKEQYQLGVTNHILDWLICMVYDLNITEEVTLSGSWGHHGWTLCCMFTLSGITNEGIAISEMVVQPAKPQN